MTKGSVLFLSLAPTHSSAGRRLNDCASGNFTISAPNFGIDKVHKSIVSRLLSGDYFAVFRTIITDDSDIVWTWGHDVCFVASLAMMFSPRRHLIWDISDINHNLLRNNTFAKFLSLLEAALIRRANRLFLTSDAFYDNYYSRIISNSKCAVIENKKNESTATISTPTPLPLKPFIVVFAGIFRSNPMLQMIARIANSIGSDIQFHLHGACDRNTDIANALKGVTANNVQYFGEFHSRDLPQIYNSGHIVWGFVDELANQNEQWLLTNRIYDAIAYGRPIITNNNTHSGSTVRLRGIGLSVDYDDDSIAYTLRQLFANDGALYNKLSSRMPDPREAYLLGAYKTEIENILLYSFGGEEKSCDGSTTPLTSPAP